MPGRRLLHFESLDDAAREAEVLLAGGYARVGRWSLGTMGDHLGRAMIYSCEGFPRMWPWPACWLVRRLGLKGILARQVWTFRFPAPISVNWHIADQDGVACLLRGIQRFQASAESLSPHIVLGPLSREQWLQFHLWHCEHHFSFLIPTAEQQPPAALTTSSGSVAPHPDSW